MKGFDRPMGLRNILVLFLSVMAISLVVLIIFFSLFFEHVDLTFNTRMPDTAPTLQGMEAGTPENTGDARTRTPLPTGQSAELNVPSESAKVTNPPAPYLGAEAELPVGPKPNPNSLPADDTVVPSSEDETSVDSEEPAATSDTPSKPNLIPEREASPAPPVPTPPRALPSAPSPSAPVPRVTQAPTSRALYRVYVAGFDNPAEANMAAQRFAGLGLRPTVKTVGGQVIVQLGVFSSQETANRTAQNAGAAVEVLPQ